MRLNVLKFALMGALLALPVVSRADNFVLSVDPGPYFGSDTLTFSLPASPLNTIVTDPSYFEIPNVTAVDAGPDESILINVFVNNAGDLAFYVQEDGFFPYFIGSPADPLYSGPATAPTFIPGTYSGIYYPSLSDEASQTDGSTGTLTITATPEPSSLILLGTGVVGLAGAARRKFSK